MLEQQLKVNKSDLVYALLSNFYNSSIDSVGQVVLGKIVVVDKKAGICIIDAGLKMEGVVPIKEFFQVYDKENLLLQTPEYFINNILCIRSKEDITKINSSIFDNFNKAQKVLSDILDSIESNKTEEATKLMHSMIDNIILPLHEKDCVFEGAKVNVYITNLDSNDGKKVLSREKAIREESFEMLKRKMATNETVYGVTFAKVKGGLFVDFNGFIAFLPGSQIDENNVKDVSYLMGVKHAFKIVNIDNENKSVIVSRKAIIDETHKEARDIFYSSTHEGSIITGVVKNITDYGAFIDLGCGLDGLLHLTDISWNKISHPSEVLKIGQKVEAKVTKCDQVSGKITLSMKHITENSWLRLVKEMEVGQTVSGRITSIADYGVFVAIASEVEGLVHMSEISWEGEPAKNIKKYNVGDEISAMILSIDPDKRRISLSIRMTLDNPYKKFAESNTINDVANPINAVVSKVTDHHIYIKIGDIDGTISMEDAAWTIDHEAIISKYKAGAAIKVVYIGSDEKFIRLKFGVKQLYPNPFVNKNIEINKVVTCVVTDVKHDKVCVEIGNCVLSHVKRFDLSREKSEQRTDRFTVGDKIDAKVISISEIKDQNASRRIAISIKEMEEDNYNNLLAQYGSSDTGASIADILGMKLENIKN
jgi:small subunit ribosomal protein S1